MKRQMDPTPITDDLPKNTSISNIDKHFNFLDIPRVAVEAANIGTWVIEATTKTLLPSNRMKELFGYQAEEEMSFESAISQIGEKHREKVLKAMEAAFTNKETFQIEYPVRGFHDQKLRWVSFWGGFITPEESAHFFSGVIMDITDRKQNDLRKSKFIGMISHELKTPLTALKAYVQMLNNWAKKQKDHFTVGALSKVEKQVKKMTSMINSFLNLSGVESGQIHLNKQDFSMDGLISEVIDETRFINPQNSIVLIPCEPVNVIADRDKIEQVLINLLNNAVKYSAKGSAAEIHCERQENWVKVSIKDNGMGIREEDIAKLFQPHYRVESREMEKISGFGIGLYLCSEIIKLHDGEMSVQSTIGKGSTFSFTLPLL